MASQSYRHITSTLDETKQQLQLQIERQTPENLKDHIAKSLNAQDLLEWKLSVSTFFQLNNTATVVTVKDVQEHSQSFVAKIETGRHTALQVFNEARQVPHSLRNVLLMWLSALNTLEATFGLSYVDPDLGNFTWVAESQTWKLADVTSLQPLYAVFDASPPPDTPPVPSRYLHFLRGSATRPTLQSDFTRRLRESQQRHLVQTVTTMLSVARTHHHTTDTVEDLDRVEEFLHRVAVPAVQALGHGVRADRFHREVFDAGRDFLEKGFEDECLRVVLSAVGSEWQWWWSALLVLILSSLLTCLFF